MSISGINMTSPMSAFDLVSSNAVTAKAKAQSTASPKTSSTSGSGLDSTTTGTTFLNLLVKELQNQDPTAPMDSTAMVGQMISLNQLDQLISINQTISGASTSTTTKAKSAVSTEDATGSSSVMAARASLLNNTYSPTSAQAATLAASNPNSALDFSNLNIPYGGK